MIPNSLFIFAGVHIRWLRLWGGIAVLLVLGTACASSRVTLSPTPTPASQLLSDDFASPNPAWALFDTEASAVYVQQEELYLEDRGKGVAVYSPLVGKSYEDVDVTVQVRQVQGAMDNWMGVMCHLQDEANYYLLAISADGYYLIQKVAEDVATPLVGPEVSEIIQKGRAKNQLEVRCEGNTLSLKVNGRLLITRSDESVGGGGEVALFVDAMGSGNTVVAFDNFVLSNP